MRQPAHLKPAPSLPASLSVSLYDPCSCASQATLSTVSVRSQPSSNVVKLLPTFYLVQYLQVVLLDIHSIRLPGDEAANSQETMWMMSGRSPTQLLYTRSSGEIGAAEDVDCERVFSLSPVPLCIRVCYDSHGISMHNMAEANWSGTNSAPLRG